MPIADTVPPEFGTGAEPVAFGLMQVDDILLALPVEGIREVIPGQRTYAALPIAADGLCGALSLRGTIIPVLDLRRVLDLPGTAPDAHVVVVMRCEGRLLGLLVDRVCGMGRVAANGIFALETRNPLARTPLATHGFMKGDRVAVVLDVGRIAALPNMPLVAEERAGEVQQRLEVSEPLLFFTFGASHFAIEALHVDATVPRTRIQQNALTGGYCLGVIQHHGYEVPVVDTLAALGIGAPMQQSDCQIMVLRFPEGMLGFALDDVRRIRRVPRTDILPMPVLPMNGAALFRGVLADEGDRQYLLLDADAVRACPDFAILAGLRNPITVAGSDTVTAIAAKGVREPYLTYLVGDAEQTSPLVHIAEVLTFPDSIIPVEDGSALLGLFKHRGRAVPLICLGAYLRQTAIPDPTEGRVLLVQDGEQTVGFVVAATRSIESVLKNAPFAEILTSQGETCELVSIGEGEKRRMLPRIDLIGHMCRISTAGLARPSDDADDMDMTRAA